MVKTVSMVSNLEKKNITIKSKKDTLELNSRPDLRTVRTQGKKI